MTEKYFLPSGYKQLSYIESTGTQYIDTGYKGSTETSFEANIQYTQSGSFNTGSFGSYSPWFRIAFASSTIYNQRGGSGTFLTIPFDTSAHTFYSTPTLLKIDNNELVIEKRTITENNNMFLFAWSDSSGSVGQYCKAKLYSFKILDNNTLVRNFVPCTDPNGVVGMYDLVGKKFYDNDGTGTFTAGQEITVKKRIVMTKDKLPDEYQELSYLETQSVAGKYTWINTGINTSQFTNAIVYGSCSETNRGFIGAGSSGSSTDRFLLCTAPSGTARVASRLDGTVKLATTLCADKTKMEVDLTKKQLIVNDTEVVSMPYSSELSTADIYLFGANYSSGGNPTVPLIGKIYEVIFKNNNATVAHFIPCYRKSDGVNGMYDKVSKTFYTNAGTGEFVRGEEVTTLTPRFILMPKETVLPSAYQKVEYLESSGTQYIDTGFKPNPTTTKFEARVSGNFNSRFLCGARTIASSTNENNCNVYSVSYSIRKDWICSSAYIDETFTSTDIVDISCLNQTMVVNGKTYTGDKTKGTNYLDYNFVLFSVNTAGTITSSCFVGKYYYCKLYDNNVLVRHFIPCIRKSDSVAGMYDTVNGVFYTNAGTGTFLTGSEVHEGLRLVIMEKE